MLIEKYILNSIMKGHFYDYIYVFTFNLFFYISRYELVPKVVKEDEFWRNYFYRLNLIKQSFDLKDLVSLMFLCLQVIISMNHLLLAFVSSKHPFFGYKK
jgi:hypothetical protein